MDWLPRIFGVLFGILSLVAIILGVLIRNRQSRRQDTQGTANETQLDRIENKSDTAFLYNLGITGMVAGLAVLTISVTKVGGWALFFVGVGLAIAGIACMFRPSAINRFRRWFGR